MKCPYHSNLDLISTFTFASSKPRAVDRQAFKGCCSFQVLFMFVLNISCSHCPEAFRRFLYRKMEISFSYIGNHSIGNIPFPRQGKCWHVLRCSFFHWLDILCIATGAVLHLHFHTIQYWECWARVREKFASNPISKHDKVMFCLFEKQIRVGVNSFWCMVSNILETFHNSNIWTK